MTSQRFNKAEARRYRQSGALMAVGFVLTIGALVWAVWDAASGGDGLLGAWLTVPGIGMVVVGLWWWSRTVGKALRRWQQESISDRMEEGT